MFGFGFDFAFFFFLFLFRFPDDVLIASLMSVRVLVGKALTLLQRLALKRALSSTSFTF